MPMKPISASQIKAAKQCLRRWAYRQIDGRPEPSSPAMAKGTALHTIAEDYLKHGTAPPDDEFGRLFMHGLPFLPPPGTAQVEGKFNTELHGVAYTGAIDLTHTREGVLVLQDHKTSSNPTKYGLREKADYLADPQALIYALHLMLRHGVAEIVPEWVYYQTKGKPKAVAHAVKLTLAEVDEAFATVVHPTATELVNIRRKGLTAGDLPRNTDSCMAYNTRCPHYDVCNPLGASTDMALPIDDDFFAEPTTTKAPAQATKPTLMETLDTSDDEEAQAEKALAAAKAAKAAKVAKQQQDAIDAAAAEEKAKAQLAAQATRDLINAPEKAAKKAVKVVLEASPTEPRSALVIVCEELSAALAKIAARL